ncbi:hypothetical protein SAMN02745116_00600 [Pilibacter termitis]|uniref:Uncharacterized protein n=1 Tax=Pilibacter termitis TaxID=263852 RepID=A0A1T4LBD1_9ENTE|nr:hypothetical protein SAMN02745116_00600 [Pilibacter termitis]
MRRRECSKTKMTLLKEYGSFYLRFIMPLVVFSAFVEAFVSKTLGG